MVDYILVARECAGAVIEGTVSPVRVIGQAADARAGGVR